jgi:hypothetical protein
MSPALPAGLRLSCFFSAAVLTGAVASTWLAGAAETWTGGGGQVFSPLRTTVTERWTTSSKSIRS